MSGDQWWEEGKSDAVYTVVQGLDTEKTTRQAALLSCLRLYNDCPILGWGGAQYMQRLPSDDEPLSYNAVRSVTDTIHAEITQSRPRAMFLTSGGDFEIRQRAEKLSKFHDGVYAAAKGDRKTSLSALDAILMGTSFVKVFDEFDKVEIERVFPGEIHVDDRDAQDGDPRCIYQIKHADRARMRRKFPDAVAIVNGASPGTTYIAGGSSRSQTADMIEVVEAWHLPSGPDAGDGRHVIAVSSGTLLDEEWESESFPFAKLDWTEPLLGYFGLGIGDQLRGVQFEMNRLVEEIRKAQKLMGNFKVWLEQGSNVAPEHINNEDGMIGFYQGTAPVFATYQAVHPEVYARLDALWVKAYEIPGVSAMNARAEKPGGLDSGKAIRAFSDIQSKRFLAFGRRWEEFHLDIAHLSIECARRIAKRVPSFSVVYRGKDSTERIEWSEVDIANDAYVMKCFPTSMLPNTPAGKLATLQDLFNAQIIDHESFLELSDFPDLEAARRRKTAGRDVIEKRIEKILSEGAYLPPEGFFDLQRCFDQGVLAYCQGQLDGVPEERLEMLRDFIQEAKEMLAASKPPPPPPMPMDPMAPPPPDAMPAPPPLPMVA